MACKALSLSSSSSSHAPFPTKTLRLRRTLRSDCLSKTSFSLYVNNRIDRWYNPDRRRSFIHPKIVRRWIQSDSPPSPYDSQERFTVVSHNILADRNASKHRGFYSNVPSEYMNWDYRKRVICEELIGLDPDIICLQEVDKYYDLLITMEKEGYAGTYKRRTGDTVDGCAMFWKSDVFKLLEGESIKFKEFGLRDNVAQLSVFEMCKADSRRIVVGNIHVLFNQNQGDIKLGQIRLLLSRAHTLSEKWGTIPVVLAGDFNSTPQSAVYKFLSSSELNITLYDRRDLSGQRSCHPAQFSSTERQISKPCILMDRCFEYCWTDEEVKTATGDSSSTVVEHSLKLSSSYATVKGSTISRDSLGEPLATSYHSSFLGTVDYLWYSDNLVPTRVLDTPSIDILRKTGGLPTKVQMLLIIFRQLY
ncbi:Endonuclease/exonuclease/phosphatase [Macleaya cordata]|uniref:Endonuclease/exonuclease/phosphatase n=1 Tax=Macleaya cordata TaxID=56857 RepID=A0A200Q3I8_MACCD|nr:Endonuclease/exonuclease/phosphatase [Macleaya cordata]